MSLKNKSILITAGPTWVPIDSVRVISNIATGETGMFLAQRLMRVAPRVTLLLGPVTELRIDKKIKVINYTYYEELRKAVRAELTRRRYDIIIHSAAVSDFTPVRSIKGKYPSGNGLNLKLKPLPKIITDIRRLAPGAKLVMFKLEPGASDAVLLKAAKAAQIKAGADMIVACRLNPYRAFIIDKSNSILSVKNKQELTQKLIKIL